MKPVDGGPSPPNATNSPKVCRTLLSVRCRPRCFRLDHLPRPPLEEGHEGSREWGHHEGRRGVVREGRREGGGQLLDPVVVRGPRLRPSPRGGRRGGAPAGRLSHPDLLLRWVAPWQICDRSLRLARNEPSVMTTKVHPHLVNHRHTISQPSHTLTPSNVHPRLSPP